MASALSVSSVQFSSAAYGLGEKETLFSAGQVQGAIVDNPASSEVHQYNPKVAAPALFFS